MQNNYNPDVLSCLANLSSDEVFTPPKLANEILDLLPKELWRDKNATFLDPVSKSGVFLREIAKRLLEGLKDEIPDLQKRIDHIYTKQIFGIGITELTSLISRRSVYCSKDANGKYSIVNFNDEIGNIFFDDTKHDWKNGRCSYCGASQSEYEREQGLETHAYQFIHNNLPDKIKNMKFDVIIGNPPYQLKDNGAQASATPLYHKFIQQAKKLNPRFLVMIIPSRWFSGGKGLNDFRNEMLHDDRIRILHDYNNASECFPGVEIKGGVCYFLWDRNNKGLCKVFSHSEGKVISEIERPLLEKNADVFIRHNEAISIFHKVRSKNEESFSKIVSPGKPFGLRGFFNDFKNKSNNSVKIYANQKVGYISPNQILHNKELINQWKIFVPKAWGVGNLQHDLIKPFIGEKNTCCTETYLLVGPFNNKKIAENTISYMKTKFFHLFISFKKITQDAWKKAYELVPMQDFSESWTDEKLYKKYKLTKEEIEFIESMIRPMN
ncbi:MAG: restriction endonuclease [Crenarchaeota archaeon]|nr:restriction endonuclease [Thermoproteota archaeon]